MDENLDEPLSPLRVMPKKEWLNWKEKFKQLTKKIKSKNKKIVKSKKLKKKTLLKFKILVEMNENRITKADIKVALLHYVEPVFIDFMSGDEEGYIRFFEENEKNDFLLNWKKEEFKVKNCVVEFFEVDDEEEKRYFEKVEKIRDKLKREKRAKKPSV